MKYMGSKARFAKEILPIILDGRKQNQWYIEPFCGGCNTIDKVTGNRLANDINPYLIGMWVAIIQGWLPNIITKEFYKDIKDNKHNFPDSLVGWVGFICSYSGKYFGGYAGDYPESRRLKNGKLPNYQQESKNSILKQINSLKSVIFTSSEYWAINIPVKSIIYCDPPYQDTTKYSNEFDHEMFFDWVRNMSNLGHKVFVSEYNAPDDFECVWSKEAKSSLSANGKCGGNKISTEKLFKYRK